MKKVIEYKIFVEDFVSRQRYSLAQRTPDISEMQVSFLKFEVLKIEILILWLLKLI